MPERPRGETGGQETGKEGDEHSWGLNDAGVGSNYTLDAHCDFVYSSFELLHSNPGCAIVTDCVFAAILPLSHLQATAVLAAFLMAPVAVLLRDPTPPA